MLTQKSGAGTVGSAEEKISGNKKRMVAIVCKIINVVKIKMIFCVWAKNEGAYYIKQIFANIIVKSYIYIQIIKSTRNK